MLDRSQRYVDLGPATVTGVTVRWKPVLYLRPDFERWLACRTPPKDVYVRSGAWAAAHTRHDLEHYFQKGGLRLKADLRLVRTPVLHTRPSFISRRRLCGTQDQRLPM